MAQTPSTPWSDINLPSFAQSSTGAGENPSQAASAADEPAAPAQSDPPHARLNSAQTWEAGPKGFTYLEYCQLVVEGELLVQNTAYKRVQGDLFAIFDNQEEDLGYVCEGFLDHNQPARLKVKLFFHKQHHPQWQRDAATPCSYVVRNIRHAKGENVIAQSALLQMPQNTSVTVQYLEFPDVLFNHNSAVPCIDASGTLVGVLVAAQIFAHNNPDKEVILYGHTDSSGETDFNLNLSELRCKAIKALLDNDQSAFVAVCRERSKVEDYQTILKTLSESYGWDCNPGGVDNQDGPQTREAVERFQSDYNVQYEQSLAVDGAVGPGTWGALFNVIRDRIWTITASQIGETMPQLSYGESGSGIHPCGEEFAQNAYAKQGRKSRADRRVEIVFKKPEDQIGTGPYVGQVVMEPVAPAPQPQKKLTGMELWCKHEDKGKKRVAKSGAALAIVPDLMAGDTITLQALCAEADASVTWDLTGYKKITVNGMTASVNVSGRKAQVKDFVLDYFLGRIRHVFPPDTIMVTATDSDKNAVKGKVLVYPPNATSFDWNLKKKWSEVFAIIEQIKNGCNFLAPEDKPVEWSYLEGAISFGGGWKEDSKSNQVFFAVSVKGGYQPLIGINFRKKIPIKGLANLIPDKLLNYGVNLIPYFVLKGEIALTVSIERISVKKFQGSGEADGSLTGSLNITAVVGNGKVLKVESGFNTGIGITGQMVIKKKDDAEEFFCEAKVSGKWNGMKGTIAWSVFDGKWSGKYDCTIIEEKTLGETKPRVIFPR